MNSRLTVPTHEEITARAQQLWQLAGNPAHRDLELWLAAEAEVDHERDETSRAADAAEPMLPSTATKIETSSSPRSPRTRRQDR